jgi:hypothetical protein
MKIAVCIPSRGTVYSQTIDEVLRELKDFGADWQIFWSHANPIPDCFNKITENALADKDVTHIWYVEEDMVLPEGILKHMITEMVENNWTALASDYPLIEVPSRTVYRDPYGAAYFSGCGCTIIQRKVFQMLSKPFWRTDVEWNLVVKDDYLLAKPKWVKDTSKVYGYQDITFGLSLYLKNNPIMVSSMNCGQRKMVHVGGKDNNQGHHVIKEYNDLSKKRMFTEDTDNNLIELYANDDIEDRIHVTREQANELISRGYKRFNYGQVVLEDPNKVWEKIK